MSGSAHGFRYRDPLDDQITGQNIGAGDGATAAFQIVKDYAVAGQVYRRTIAKPVAGTVGVSLDGVPQESGWGVETATGIITFAAPPGNGVAVSVDCQFHVPVRFDHDELQINLATFMSARRPTSPWSNCGANSHAHDPAVAAGPPGRPGADAGHPVEDHPPGRRRDDVHRPRPGYRLRWPHPRGRVRLPAVPAYQAEIGLDVPNMSFQGALVDNGITADDILAGVYDAALLEVFIVNYADLSQGHLPLLAAIFGQADLIDLNRYEIEVRSLKTLLDQPAGILYTPKCRHTFGDAGCRYDANGAKVAGTVTAASGATRCTDSARGEPAQHFFNGRLKFTTGANAGYQRDVIDHAAGGAFTFLLPFPRAIAVGDRYEAWPGCLYTFADCRDRWANTLNFGGSPHVPGRDDVLLYPDPR